MVVGIRDLARINQLIETYLSKIFTKLRKAGLVRSVPGASGGYELARPAEEKLRDSLKTRNLKWLHETVSADYGTERKAAIARWFGVSS